MAVICYRSGQTVKSKQTLRMREALNILQLLIGYHVCKPLLDTRPPCV